jgi:hypothetical protein
MLTITVGALGVIAVLLTYVLTRRADQRELEQQRTMLQQKCEDVGKMRQLQLEGIGEQIERLLGKLRSFIDAVGTSENLEQIKSHTPMLDEIKSRLDALLSTETGGMAGVDSEPAETSEWKRRHKG